MNQLLIDLKNKLNPIVELIKDKNDVFYFDYPLHLNVGDFEYDLDLEEVKAKITPNTTILLHGGGNFGDLYPQHQKIREEMVTHFPNNRIIVLPQTAYFKHEENLQKSAALFRSHSDCHLLARDERTANLFAQFSDHVYLSPDMAHQLYGTMEIKQGTTGEQLYFLRKDIEASDVEKNILAQLPANSNVKDWEDILSTEDDVVLALSWRISKMAKKFGLGWLKDLCHQFWYAYTQRIVKRVAQVFLANDKVTTTRLHGHIFSCLLEIPNRVCDNSYGKNSSYAKLWTKELNFVELDK